jgi:hypothetical protein
MSEVTAPPKLMIEAVAPNLFFNLKQVTFWPSEVVPNLDALIESEVDFMAKSGFSQKKF